MNMRWTAAAPLLLLTTVASADYAQPGPLGHGAVTTSIPFDGQTISADLYVPDGAGPWPVVALGHGFANPASTMRGYGERLASRGMIVIVPEFGLFASDHARNGRVLEAAISHVAALGEQPGGALGDRVDASRFAFGGHSAGGLAAFLAAAAQPSARAVVLLDPVDTGTSLALPVASEVTSPVQFLFAEPSNCNSNGNGAAWFAELSGPRSRMRVVSATHCEPQDPMSGVCTFGCPGASTARTVFFQRYAVAWLSWWLTCDEAARSTVDGTALQSDVQAGVIADVEHLGLPAEACPLPQLDAGVPDGDAGVVPPDAGESDGGSDLEIDAGIDAGQSAHAPPEPAPAPPPAGCGCGSSNALSALALLSLLFVRRGRS